MVTAALDMKLLEPTQQVLELQVEGGITPFGSFKNQFYTVLDRIE